MMARPRGEMAELIEKLARERGARVLGIKAPAEPEPVPAPGPVAPGETIVEFEIYQRPIPWKAAHVLKRGGAFKDAKLVAWQDAVREQARRAMDGREPYAGPVELRFYFSLIRKAGSPPDTSNLTKACEDSLQGVVILNDRQANSIVSHRTFGERDFARVRVLAWTPR